jgi:nucleoid-associated protein YgaU
MARHPAGRDLEDGGAHPAEKYTVQAGDTLWDIAERVLDRDDVRAIARYWPKIHRANRQVLGADPNRLTPGQVLLLPSTRTMPN